MNKINFNNTGINDIKKAYFIDGIGRKFALNEIIFNNQKIYCELWPVTLNGKKVGSIEHGNYYTVSGFYEAPIIKETYEYDDEEYFLYTEGNYLDDTCSDWDGYIGPGQYEIHFYETRKRSKKSKPVENYFIIQGYNSFGDPFYAEEAVTNNAPYEFVVQIYGPTVIKEDYNPDIVEWEYGNWERDKIIIRCEKMPY